MTHPTMNQQPSTSTGVKAPPLQFGNLTSGAPTIGALEQRPDNDLLTLSEVGDILRVPVNTLRWWRQQGTGPHFFKIGRRLVTTVGDLTTWLEHQKNGTNPAA